MLRNNKFFIKSDIVFIFEVHGKNNFAERFKILLNTDLKIILLES